MQKVRINKNAARVKHLCFIAIVPLLYIFIIEILRHARGKIYASAVYFQAQSTDSGEPALFPSWADRVFEDRQELVNAIVWERAYEMCGEGHEYFDTHRYGAKWLAKVIAEPLNGFLALPEQGPGDDPDKEPGIFRYNYVENIYPTDPAELRKSLLCAFPTNTEGTFNTAIDITSDQNDFFWQ